MLRCSVDQHRLRTSEADEACVLFVGYLVLKQRSESTEQNPVPNRPTYDSTLPAVSCPQIVNDNQLKDWLFGYLS